MADIATNPLAKATSTTEGKLTIAAVATGVITMVAGYLYPLLQQTASQNPRSTGLQLALIIAGAAMVTISSATFSVSRATLKTELMVFVGALAESAPAIYRLALSHFFPQLASTSPIATPPETPSAKASQS